MAILFTINNETTKNSVQVLLTGTKTIDKLDNSKMVNKIEKYVNDQKMFYKGTEITNANYEVTKVSDSITISLELKGKTNDDLDILTTTIKNIKITKSKYEKEIFNHCVEILNTLLEEE